MDWMPFSVFVKMYKLRNLRTFVNKKILKRLLLLHKISIISE